MASDSVTVKKVFKLPIWYIPSDTEIARLMSYIRSENSEDEARLARILDCSACCDEDDCYFCGEIEPVAAACCDQKYQVPRRE